VTQTKGDGAFFRRNYRYTSGLTSLDVLQKSRKRLRKEKRKRESGTREGRERSSLFDDREREVYLK